MRKLRLAQYPVVEANSRAQIRYEIRSIVIGEKAANELLLEEQAAIHHAEEMSRHGS